MVGSDGSGSVVLSLVGMSDVDVGSRLCSTGKDRCCSVGGRAGKRGVFVSVTVSVCVGDADGGLVRKRGACLVEDIDGNQVLLVGRDRQQQCHLELLKSLIARLRELISYLYFPEQLTTAQSYGCVWLPSRSCGIPRRGHDKV